MCSGEESRIAEMGVWLAELVVEDMEPVRLRRLLP